METSQIPYANANVPLSVHNGLVLPSVTAFGARFMTCTIVVCLPWDADRVVIQA